MRPHENSATLHKLADHRLLTATDERRLSKAVLGKNKAAAKRAIDELVVCNMKLVIRIASEMSNNDTDIDDLISEGAIGLQKAAGRFDSERGAKFSTYSAWWIRQSMLRLIGNQGRTIRIPIHLLYKINQVRKVRNMLEAETGVEPSAEDIAEATGLKDTVVETLLAQSRRTISIHTPAGNSGEDSDSTLESFIMDENAFSPAEVVAKHAEEEATKKLTKHLTPREQEIIIRRFGLHNKNPETLEEIGSDLKLTRERIRQIQERALKNMRKILERQRKAVETVESLIATPIPGLAQLHEHSRWIKKQEKTTKKAQQSHNGAKRDANVPRLAPKEQEQEQKPEQKPASTPMPSINRVENSVQTKTQVQEDRQATDDKKTALTETERKRLRHNGWVLRKNKGKRKNDLPKKTKRITKKERMQNVDETQPLDA